MSYEQSELERVVHELCGEDDWFVGNRGNEVFRRENGLQWSLSTPVLNRGGVYNYTKWLATVRTDNNDFYAEGEWFDCPKKALAHLKEQLAGVGLLFIRPGFIERTASIYHDSSREN